MVDFKREKEHNERARQILALFDLLPGRHRLKVLESLKQRVNDSGNREEQIEA